jgi:hypothetical protein
MKITLAGEVLTLMHKWMLTTYIHYCSPCKNLYWQDVVQVQVLLGLSDSKGQLDIQSSGFCLSFTSKIG